MAILNRRNFKRLTDSAVTEIVRAQWDFVGDTVLLDAKAGQKGQQQSVQFMLSRRAAAQLLRLLVNRAVFEIEEEAQPRQ